jgi:hypothetical protein
MLHAADGSVLDVGRRTRALSPGLRRTLEHRDAGCRFPGCGNRLCDAHHVEPWAAGGATSLANTLLLCRRHHRAVHEEGFSIALGPNGEARFYRPDGRPFAQVPELPRSSGEPIPSLVTRLASHGVTVDGGATMPSWWGESVDYGWAIESLRWLRSHDRPHPPFAIG